MISCPSCGADNRAGRRFCGQCGAPLQRVCPACGTANEEGERFCGECGAGLAVTPALLRPGTAAGDARGAPAAERRHVSILFADLVGFTPLAHERDAEDVRELLSRYFDTARTVISRYGGTVEKFIGDAVMAVWGVPTVQENDAERAVRAALELVDAVAAFGETVGVPDLRARAAVLTGEAAVNLGASGEAIVAGDLVNTASRVQAVAEPGAVFVVAATRETTEASIDYEDAGAHVLKGVAEPLRLWRARRVVAGAGGSMRPAGLEPPFVGRDRELRLLKELLHATGTENRAHLLSIVGVAGVGKTRLAWEFEKYIDGLSEKIWWHRGRCLSYGEGVAYWALAEMVRMRAGIVENEAADSARRKLSESVAEFVPEEEERRWVEPRLRQLIGLEEGAANDPRDLYAAWRFFFERLAAQQLTVLIFEEMQWADSGLLDFIEYLLEWSRNSPILAVTLARPELADRRPGWGIGKRGLTSLYLEPLSPEAMDALLDGMVPGLPGDVAARIRERAAGIPLYAVETVRMLLDRGLVVEDGGIYRAAGALDTLEVPESLHAMIAARLDSLPARERRLLQDAAVLGVSFTPAALAVVSGLPAAEVDAGLSALVAKELLSIQSDPRSPERGQYAFVQDLVRSVTLGTLARRDRRSRHLAAAEYLETSWSGDESIVAVLAAHLVAAYEADPAAPDSAQIRERARAALVRAGEHAVSLAAAASAQPYYEQAIELADDDAMRAALHQSAGETASMQGHLGEAREHFVEAERISTAHNDMSAAIRASSQLAQIDFHEGRTDSAVRRLEEILVPLRARQVDTPDADALLAEVEGRVGSYLYFAGEVDRSLEHVEVALQIAEELEIPKVLATALDNKAWIMARRNRWEESEILEEGALKVARENGLDKEVLRSLTNLGETLYERDRPERALQCQEQAEQMGRRVGDRALSAYAYLSRLPLLLDLGRWDECAALHAMYVEQDAADLREDVQTVGISAYVVWLYLWRGEVGRAQQVLDECERPFGEAPTTPELRALFDAAHAGVASAQRRHADAFDAANAALRGSLDHRLPITARIAFIEAAAAAFGLDRPDSVRELMNLAREQYPQGRQPALDAHLLRWQARLDSLTGEDGGSANFQRALDAFERLNRPFWAAVTRLEWAESLAQNGRRDDADVQANAAHATFTELGALPWLERADAVLRRASEPAVLSRSAG